MDIDQNNSNQQRVRRSARRQEQRQRRNQQAQQNAEINNENAQQNPERPVFEVEAEPEEEEKVVDQQQVQQQPQQPQPQPGNLCQKIHHKRFRAKIPNPNVLRDFLVNKGNFYVPPQKDLTTLFVREILSGQKKLLKLDKVKWVDQVPNWAQFSTKSIWAKAKNDPRYIPYFASYSASQAPSRKYLLNIANTVVPNSVVQAVIQIREERENKKTEDAPIILTNEFAALLEDFESISTDQRRRGLTQLRDFQKCSMCLSEIRSNSGQFNCGRHKAHRHYLITYYNSEIGKKSQYACPFRCPK